MIPGIDPPWYLTDYYTTELIISLHELENEINNPTNNIKELKKSTLNIAKKAFKNSLRYAGDRIEICRLTGTYYWITEKRKRASYWWEKALVYAEESGSRLEESRNYFEI